jgi:hypothetical protein
MDELSLGIRALPTADIRNRRARAAVMAHDERRPVLERLAGLVGVQLIDYAVDDVPPTPDGAIELLAAERAGLTNLMMNLETAR